MKQDQNNSLLTEDEIDLRTIILSIWKFKIFIIITMLVSAFLAGVLSCIIIKPVYKSQMIIVINMPEIYQTKYGDYTLPITTDWQYLTLMTSTDTLYQTMDKMGYSGRGISLESFRDRIEIGSINSGDDQNSFTVTVSADSRIEAKESAKTLYNEFINFLNVTTARGAVSYYLNHYFVQLLILEDELSSEKAILKSNEILLAQTPQTIVYNNAENDNRNTNNRDFIILEELINPNYTSIEYKIIQTKQRINEIDNSIQIYQGYLGELATLEQVLEEYKETGVYNIQESDLFDISKSSVFFLSQPTEPDGQSSPDTLMNIIIGAVIGGILSTAFVLFRWWRLKDKKFNNFNSI